jgi:TetR/AcrR family transcriptional regulator, repressor of fatR-cypB operon
MRRGADTREALLDAALEVMSERGFHGTSVPELAERAGVGAATMYRHFESKEALANALYVRAKRQLASLLWDGFPHGLSPRKALHEVWVRMARAAVRNGATLVFLEMHHHASYLAPESMAACETLVMGPLEDIVRAGQAQGLIRAGEPSFLLSFLWGAFLGLLKPAMERDGKVDERRLLEGEELAWAAIRPSYAVAVATPRTR